MVKAIVYSSLEEYSCLRHPPANRRHGQAPGAVDAKRIVSGCGRPVCDVRHISWQSVLVLHNCNSGHFIGQRMAVKLDSVDDFVDKS